MIGYVFVAAMLAFTTACAAMVGYTARQMWDDWRNR